MKKVLGFVKGKSKGAKLLVMSMMISMLAVCSAIGASAETGTSADLSSSFSSALSTIQSDIFGFIGMALPVGLAVFGAIIAIKKGIGFVRCLIGKS